MDFRGPEIGVGVRWGGSADDFGRFQKALGGVRRWILEISKSVGGVRRWILEILKSVGGVRRWILEISKNVGGGTPHIR